MMMLCWQIVRGEQKEGNKRWDLQLHNVLWLRNVKYKYKLSASVPTSGTDSWNYLPHRHAIVQAGDDNDEYEDDDEVMYVLLTTCRPGMQHPDIDLHHDDNNEYEDDGRPVGLLLGTTCRTGMQS